MERTGNISPQDVDAQKVLQESKIFEKALRESEERLRLAQQVARVGTFEWNIKSGVNRWTPELEIIYGLPPGSFPGTQAAWEELVHPEDREKVVRAVRQGHERRCLRGRVACYLAGWLCALAVRQSLGIQGSSRRS